MSFEQVLNSLEKGELRSATYTDGKWVANIEVKKEILEAFKAGKIAPYGETHGERFSFNDKHTLFPREFTLSDNVRIVPGGSSVRRGAYLAPSVIVMPPSYINVGAFVDSGTMVDSHVLVGSCAQIGKNVHLSAGVQIGGVLEPVGESPVIIEDGAFIGAGSIIVEGVVVKKGAVIAPGTILSKGVVVYDCVNERVLDKGAPIPENAVVIAGTRPLSNQSPWVKSQGLSIKCALIVKYRDASSNASLVLESLLR